MQMLENPLGEELMILNPVRRRRRSPARRRRTVRISVPRRNPPKRRKRRYVRRYRSNPIVANPRKRRRRKSHKRRYRKNPVARGGFIERTGGQIISGGFGAAAGAGGFAISKAILPAEYDRHVLGYALHGAAGTAIAALGTGIIKPFRKYAGIAVAGVWATVLFRVFLNHVLSKIMRPAPAIGPSEAARVSGMEGVEEAMSLAEDFSMVTAEEEMANYHDGRHTVGDNGGIGAVGQEYVRPEPYDVGDVGQEYVRPQPYDSPGIGNTGQVYQPARGLPAASMPVDGTGQAFQEAPELGAYSRRPVTWSTPLW